LFKISLPEPILSSIEKNDNNVSKNENNVLTNETKICIIKVQYQLLNQGECDMYKFDTGKIRGFMAEYKLVQQEVCDSLKISVPAFRNKMNGKSSFNVNEVCALADLFKVNPGFLFIPKVSYNDTNRC